MHRTNTLAMAAVGLIATAALGLPGTASASTRSATDTVAGLEEEGYHVQINGPQSTPLSNCKTTAVHGLRDSNIDDDGRRIDKDLFTTVYVDVVCQDVS